MKQTITKSKEDIDFILSASNLIRWVIIAGFIMLAFLLAPLIISPCLLNDMMLGTATGKLAQLLSPLLISIFEGSVTANGSFSPVLYLVLLTQMAIQYITCFLIFDTLCKVFMNIKNGQSPFTAENVKNWKRCAKIYALIATIYFLFSILMRGASIILILNPLFANAFFNALSIIFEYGSQLQKESDETL